MAGALSDWLEVQLANHVLRNIPYTSPVTVYLALFTTDPTDTSTAGSEVTGGAYARQSIAFGAPTSGSGLIVNSAQVNYPVATADWGNIAYWQIYDAATLGNPLIHGAWTIPKYIYTGDQFIVRAGDLDITWD